MHWQLHCMTPASTLPAVLPPTVMAVAGMCCCLVPLPTHPIPPAAGTAHLWLYPCPVPASPSSTPCTHPPPNQLTLRGAALVPPTHPQLYQAAVRRQVTAEAQVGGGAQEGSVGKCGACLCAYPAPFIITATTATGSWVCKTFTLAGGEDTKVAVPLTTAVSAGGRFQPSVR